MDNTYKKLTTNLMFHTWVAIRKTGIPDGTSPLNGISLDYVSKLKKQAAELEIQGIPVMIVYSRLNLPHSEETKMEFHFKHESNIVMLCLEDMPHAIPSDSYKHLYTADLNLMDHLRIAVINHAQQVIQELLRKACEQGKEQYAFSLRTNNGNAIMYADMDIVLTANKAPVVYAKRGMCSWPKLNHLFTHNYCDLNSLDQQLRRTIEDHAAVFRRGTDVIIQYVLYGKAYEISEWITEARGKRWKPCIATGENSMLFVSYSAIPIFKKMVLDDSLIVDLHTNPDRKLYMTSDPFYRANHTLIYLQLLPYMDHSDDRTWVSDC